MQDLSPMDLIRRHLANLELHPEWRKGQSLFNSLSELRPALAEKLRTGGPDPFYVDERLSDAMLWVDEHWEDEDDDGDK